ncbi:MAG TPA: RcnB family protein [Rhizomicrobium sp.]|nr:RcnB family protein [Rhizomicrobium sp.]
MKRLLIIAAAMSLMLPAVSSAQPGQGNRPGGNGGPGGPGAGKPGGAVTLPAPVPNRPGRPDSGNRPGKPNPGRPDRPKPLPGPGMRPPPRPNPGMRPPPRPSRPQFSWRGRHFNPIVGSMFRYPPGYAYRRWTIGALLPSLFLASSYYYDDWRGLGIDAPPPGRRWVRYGSDLLLVNTRTRRVEDVITGVFY